MALKHLKTSGIADGTDPALVQPSDWNDDHIVDAGGINFLGSEVLNVVTSAGRSMLSLTAAAAGAADGFVQQSLAFKKVAMILPVDGNAATTIGYPSLTTTGTATNRYASAVSSVLFLRSKRYGFVSAATAGSFATLRVASEQVALGNGTYGGFTIVTRFGCADAAAVSGARQFCGIQNSGGIANAEPSTITGCVGVGNGAADTNLKLFYGGTTAQTPIDLGTDFPANTLSADVYELFLFSPRTESHVVYWKVTRVNTGHVAEGVINGTSVTVPANNAGVTPFRCWRCNNATALAVGLDIFHHYSETDY